jgi:hypothetical protein
LLVDLSPHCFRECLSLCVSLQVGVFGLVSKELPGCFGSFDDFNIVKVGIAVCEQVSDVAIGVSGWLIRSTDKWQRRG